jgi:hypothetical protein
MEALPPSLTSLFLTAPLLTKMVGFAAINIFSDAVGLFGTEFGSLYPNNFKN